MNKRAILLAAAAVAGTLALSGCVANASSSSDATKLTVDSTADDCVVSSGEAPSGTIAFTVSNSSDQVSEFYLLADDGLRIVGEVENVGPGVTRDLVVQAKPGDYFTVCKPGMVGDGVGRAAFTVTDSGKPVELAGDLQQQGEAAATNYVAYVKDQVAQLVPATQAFLDAYLAGDDETARSLYPTTRADYERIEPVAESFGDLDPEIDFREADVAEGDEWTGWHRIEKDLWPPAAADNGGTEYVALTPTERSYYADKLVANTQELYDAVHADDYTVTIDAISNGAIGLLEEVASGKITGEEEIWSHTDLWDFQANLEGARVAYEGVRDIVETKDADLVSQIDEQFSSLEDQLSAYGSLDSGFTYYNELTTAQVKDLADGVNALSEPLSQLTAVLVQ
ncbi:iron uptake system protein EfeO [Compostimonas suwonensis]|uniref:Iron uptake system component EfeO n=1 Tax=Compostimonas suwonensis TaxID=1048394 RepID=A0A2M9BWF5_9MICO|nr:iron uptake system protein EfeO [Compostimonas suwonensis]PJJ62254.1 iron uptake system component EfeO [Compostimonas suwonensis]